MESRSKDFILNLIIYLIVCMFYLREVSFRAQYLFLSGFLLTSLCYSHKKLLLFFLTFNSLSSSSRESAYNSGTDYLIYTHPSELFTTYFLVVFYFSFITMFPQVLWHFVDFSKPSLKRSKFDELNVGIKVAVGLICLLNFSFLILILPNCWRFLESFNESVNESTLQFFLELKIKDYMRFLESLLYVINACFMLILALHFVLKFQPLKTLLHQKGLVFFLNLALIVVCCPADLMGQLLCMFALWGFVEFTVASQIAMSKFKKYVRVPPPQQANKWATVVFDTFLLECGRIRTYDSTVMSDIFYQLNYTL